MNQQAKAKEEIERIIKRVSFKDRTFRLMEKGDGYLVQMEYMEPDVEKSGSEPVKQSTRKWYISPYMTESEIVETCWAMVCRSQIHVASEHFTYKGRRAYSQHFDVNYRVDGCDIKAFDVRE